MIRTLKSSQGRIGAVGGVIEEHEGVQSILEVTYHGNCTFLYRAPEPSGKAGSLVDGLSSANLFLSREVFERIGGFDEHLRRDEDNDFCMTLRELGYTCYQDAETVVLNKITASGRDTGAFAHFADPKRYIEDLLESRITLLARHAPWRLPILWLLDLVLIPLIFIRMKRGTYVVNRFHKAVPRFTLPLLVFFLVKNLSCFGQGFSLFFTSVFFPKNRARAGC
jgi:GT2 family glycosyltransferase